MKSLLNGGFAVLALMLGLGTLASCKHGDSGGATSRVWNADVAREALVACLDGYHQKTSIDVSETCSCVVQEAQKRWSYGDYGNDEPNHRNALVNEFVVGKCMGWSQAQLNDLVSQCSIQSKVELSGTDAAKIDKACYCQAVNAAAMWNTEKFLTNKDQSLAVLKRDGVVSSCRTQAGIARSWRAPQLLEQDNTGNVTFPQLAMTSNGEGLAIWAQFDGQRQNITTARYVAGSGWNAAQNIEQQNTGTSGSPDIAADGSGGALAVWSRYGGGGKNIWASRYSGKAWQAPVLIEDEHVTCPQNECTDNQWRIVRVASDNLGNGMAVWPASDSLWVNHYRVSDNRWLGAEKLADNGRDANLAYNKDGQAVAVWAEKNVYLRTWDPDAGWATPLILDPDNQNATPQEPRVAFHSNGSGAAIWLTGATDHRLWASFLTPQGGWGKPKVLDDGQGDSGAAQLKFDSKGAVVIVWHQKKSDRRDIWVTRSPDGKAWDKPQILNPPQSGSAFQPRVTTDANGEAMAVWNFNNGANWDVLYSLYDGTTWGQVARIYQSTGVSRIEPFVAFDRQGNGICTWFQEGTVRSMWGSIFQ